MLNRVPLKYIFLMGMKLFILVLFLFLMSCRTTRIYKDTQGYESLKERLIFPLPKQLKESSGLLKINDYFLSFNDSGGKNALYAFKEKSPDSIHEIIIPGIKNFDWEDICMDDTFLYIADIGNNFGSRDTLTVYKLKKDELFTKITHIEKIRYSYAEKSPAFFNCWKNPFDCEACIVKNDSLWLFSKNWQDESSRIYKLPTEAGFYTISEQGKIQPDMLVTGAAYDMRNDKLWLIGYHNYYPVIYRYNWENASPQAEFKLMLKNHRGLQTEAIYIDEKGKVFFTNERSIKRASLWEIEP